MRRVGLLVGPAGHTNRERLGAARSRAADFSWRVYIGPLLWSNIGSALTYVNHPGGYFPGSVLQSSVPPLPQP